MDAGRPHGTRGAVGTGPDPLDLCMAGDGPDRIRWSRRAEEITRRHEGVRCTFTGWVEPMERDRLLRDSHLLVVPSIWPEPFGQVGLEAGHLGVPSVAFRVNLRRDEIKIDGKPTLEKVETLLKII